MKFYCVVVLLCFLAVYSQAEISKEEMDEAFKALSQNCKEETKASDADLDAIIKHEVDATPEGKCLRYCLMTKFEVLTEDGKLVKPKMLKMADFMVKGDADKLKVAEEILDGCQDVTDADHCEAAFKVIKCLKDGADSRGLKVEW